MSALNRPSSPASTSGAASPDDVAAPGENVGCAAPHGAEAVDKVSTGSPENSLRESLVKSPNNTVVLVNNDHFEQEGRKGFFLQDRDSELSGRENHIKVKFASKASSPTSEYFWFYNCKTISNLSLLMFYCSTFAILGKKIWKRAYLYFRVK